jgi:hypothetical protein
MTAKVLSCALVLAVGAFVGLGMASLLFMVVG